jgi:hypothetical protein
MDIQNYEKGVKKGLAQFRKENKPDYIVHVADFDELKAVDSNSSNKRQIALATMPLFDDGLQSSNGMVTAYKWGDDEISRLLDGLFVRGVQVLMNERLDKGDEEHALLALFASDLFDKFCENGNLDSAYLRWGLAKKIADKPLNTANAKLVSAFLKLNP